MSKKAPTQAKKIPKTKYRASAKRIDIETMTTDRITQVEKKNFKKAADQFAAALTENKIDVVLGRALWLLADEFSFKMEELEVLLDVQERTLYNAKANERMPQSSNDRRRRIGLLLSIKKSLTILFPHNPEVRKNWLRVPRDTFKGHTAMEVIMETPEVSMERLFTVSRLLEMLRSGTIHELT